MRNVKTITICFSLFLMVGCSQGKNDKEATNLEGAGSASMSDQKGSSLQANIPTEKSIHVFDMPDGVTEAEWSAAIKDINAVIAKIGYPNAGYAFYKVANDSVKTNRYYFEGVWPAGDDYKTIHENPEYIKASDKLTPLYDKIKAVEMYRKVVLVK
jgi:hypothetical protein